MKTKKEITKSGTVRAVGGKTRKTKYGIVESEENPFKTGTVYTAERKESEESSENAETHSSLGEIEDQSTIEISPSEGVEETEVVKEEAEEAEKAKEEAKQLEQLESLQRLIDAMEQHQQSIEEEEKKKEESENSGVQETEEEKKEQKEKSEQQEKEQREKKVKNEVLTEYLVTQLRIRALAEILGAVKVAEEGKYYFSFIAIENVGIEIFKSSPARKGIILDFDTFPWFETSDQAKAFLELCSKIINRYCQLMSTLNPVAVTAHGDIEVIHS